MAQYTYPNNAKLTQIRQTYLPKQEVSQEILQIFPPVAVDFDKVLWEQWDLYRGTMPVRGMGGSPGKMNPVGINRFGMNPGYYGGYLEILEEELTRAREIATFATPADLRQPVMRNFMNLLNAECSLKELMAWNLLINGTYSSTDARGAVLDTQTVAFRTYTASVPWSTTATATPLYDMRQIKLFHRGYSVAFDGRTYLYANQTTINNLLLNTNASDLGGKRRTGGATFNGIGEVNEVLRADNDLPIIKAFDEGYYDNNKVFQLYIPNGTAVVIGRRLDGVPLGEWLMTRNANAPGMAPGGYEKVVDNFEREVPRKIQVHRGFNGAPVIYYPSAVIIMKGL